MEEQDIRALLALLDRLEHLLPHPVAHAGSWEEVNLIVSMLRRASPAGEARELATTMLYSVSDVVRAQAEGEGQARRELRDRASRLRGELAGLLSAAPSKLGRKRP